MPILPSISILIHDLTDDSRQQTADSKYEDSGNYPNIGMDGGVSKRWEFRSDGDEFWASIARP